MRVTEIRHLFFAADRLLLLGPPGIGKTEVIRQLAKEEAERLGRIFIDVGSMTKEQFDEICASPERYYVYLRVVAPTVFPDELGYPQLEGRAADLVPFRKLYVMTLHGIRGTLFVDEITNVQTEPQIAMFFSLIQEKEFSWGLKLADGIKVILAGNTPEWSEVVRALPKPLRARMTIINVTPPTVDEWADYMDRRYNGEWEKLTYAYLKVSPEDFIRQPTDDWENFPCPRNWSEVAVLLHELRSAPEHIKEEVVQGRLGREVGAKFAAFMRERLTEEELERFAAQPEEFFAQRLSKRILVAYVLASAPLEALLSKYDKLLTAIARRDRELFVVFLRLMSREKRLRYAPARVDLIADVVNYIKDALV